MGPSHREDGVERQPSEVPWTGLNRPARRDLLPIVLVASGLVVLISCGIQLVATGTSSLVDVAVACGLVLGGVGLAMAAR